MTHNDCELPPPDLCLGGIVLNAYSRGAVLAAIAPYKAELAAVRMHDQATGIQWKAQYDRAEKAEAENAKLREALCIIANWSPMATGRSAAPEVGQADAAAGGCTAGFCGEEIVIRIVGGRLQLESLVGFAGHHQQVFVGLAEDRQSCRIVGMPPCESTWRSDDN